MLLVQLPGPIAGLTGNEILQLPRKGGNGNMKVGRLVVHGLLVGPENGVDVIHQAQQRRASSGDGPTPEGS